MVPAYPPADNDRVDYLTYRLTARDPEAGSALQVIIHFDALLESRAGLQSIGRAAAHLAGVPARLTDPARRLTVRVVADGVAAPAGGEPDPEWPCATVTGDGATLWLERSGPAGTVGAVVLERAAGAARTVLARTRSRRPDDDPASIELLSTPPLPPPTGSPPPADSACQRSSARSPWPTHPRGCYRPAPRCRRAIGPASDPRW
jgi:hypothetical protein